MPNKRGQSTLEYALIIAVVVAALLAIQIYMKRGVEGKLRESTDEIGSQFAVENTTIYSDKTRRAKTVEILSAGETTVYTGYNATGSAEVTTTSGNETVAGF